MEPLNVTAQGVSHTVAVNGTGVVPFAVSPATVSFGKVHLNTPTAPQPLKVTNAGAAPLPITSINAHGQCAEPVLADEQLLLGTHPGRLVLHDQRGVHAGLDGIPLGEGERRRARIHPIEYRQRYGNFALDRNHEITRSAYRHSEDGLVSSTGVSGRKLPGASGAVLDYFELGEFALGRARQDLRRKWRLTWHAASCVPRARVTGPTEIRQLAALDSKDRGDQLRDGPLVQ